MKFNRTNNKMTNDCWNNIGIWMMKHGQNLWD